MSKMYLKNLLILLIILSVSLLFADQAADNFSKANALYSNGDFKKAIELYEDILKEGKGSGELYYNLGNAYYKTGNIGKARLNYERALFFMEGDEALNQNLQLLKLKLVDQIEEPPRLFISVWWENIINFINLKTLSHIVLGLFILTLLFLALFMHYRKRGRIRMKSVFILTLFIWLFSVIIWLNKIYLFETENYGVILSSTVTVYAEPSQETTELFVIHEGTKVQVQRSSHQWYEIRLADGKTGWLLQDNLEII